MRAKEKPTIKVNSRLNVSYDLNQAFERHPKFLCCGIFKALNIVYIVVTKIFITSTGKDHPLTSACYKRGNMRHDHVPIGAIPIAHQWYIFPW